METNLQERPQEPAAGRSGLPSPGPARRVIAILAVVCIVIAGIYLFAGMTREEPKAATLSAVDPVGRWYYLDADSFTVSTIDLDASGSLIADIYWGDEGRTVTHHGSWVFADDVAQITLDTGITENWRVGRDKLGNETLTYRDSSVPEKTTSMPGTIAYRSAALMEKNK